MHFSRFVQTQFLQDEKNRIEQEGGVVIFWGTWRVNGQLAVSRAIGDFEYKPYVIAIPDVREIPLNGSEDFIILACDGLWDCLSEDDAARMVYKMVRKNPGKQTIFQLLCRVMCCRNATNSTVEREDHAYVWLHTRNFMLRCVIVIY